MNSGLGQFESHDRHKMWFEHRAVPYTFYQFALSFCLLFRLMMLAHDSHIHLNAYSTLKNCLGYFFGLIFTFVFLIFFLERNAQLLRLRPKLLYDLYIKLFAAPGLIYIYCNIIAKITI